LRGSVNKSGKKNIGTYRREINRKPVETAIGGLHNLTFSPNNINATK
jgi:hypothetical protein